MADNINQGQNPQYQDQNPNQGQNPQYQNQNPNQNQNPQYQYQNPNQNPNQAWNPDRVDKAAEHIMQDSVQRFGEIASACLEINQRQIALGASLFHYLGGTFEAAKSSMEQLNRSASNIVGQTQNFVNPNQNSNQNQNPNQNQRKTI